MFYFVIVGFLHRAIFFSCQRSLPNIVGVIFWVKAVIDMIIFLFFANKNKKPFKSQKGPVAANTATIC